jgi:carboxypeptidase C (cathepsin A)
MHKNDDEIINDHIDQLNDNVYDQIKVHKKKYFFYLTIVLISLGIIILIIVLILALKGSSKDNSSSSKEEEEEEENKNDKVTNLPGYEYEKFFYSGYLNASHNKFYHYIYVKAENNSENKPLVLWLSSGPGCSALTSWGWEHGPYIIEEGNTNFTKNNYSWNKEANMIYLENPGDVGFSYINSNNSKDFEIDDSISAEENFNALKHFFKKFPKSRNKTFYISGESYGGIYVPKLAELIVKKNSNNKSEKINLKGIIIGNGVVKPEADLSDSTYFDFMFFHHLIGYEQRMKYLEICVNNINETDCNDFKKELFNLTSYVNLYDILRKCYIPSSPNLKSNNFYFNYAPWAFNKLKTNENERPSCIDSSDLENYLNNETVQNNLHVKQKVFNVCNTEVSDIYNQSKEGSFESIKYLINKNIKILIYSGDTDLVVPFNGNQLWIKQLNLTLKEKWKSWKLDDEDDYIAGYKVVYDKLTFYTVRGVGHLVPKWKPKEAFYIFSQFINENSSKKIELK